MKDSILEEDRYEWCTASSSEGCGLRGLRENAIRDEATMANESTQLVCTHLYRPDRFFLLDRARGLVSGFRVGRFWTGLVFGNGAISKLLDYLFAVHHHLVLHFFTSSFTSFTIFFHLVFFPLFIHIVT